VMAEDRRRVAPLVALVALFVPILPVAFHYIDNDKSQNFLEEDFAANIVRSAPPEGALVITGSSVCYTLWYHRFVLKDAPTLVPVHQGLMRGMLFWNAWYGHHLYRMYPDVQKTDTNYPPAEVYARLRSGDFLIDMIRRALENHTAVLVLPDPRYDPYPEPNFHPAFDAQISAAGFVRVPWGMCDRLFLRGQEPSPSQLLAINLALQKQFQTRGIYDGSGMAFVDPLQVHIPRRYLDVDEGIADLAERLGRYDTALEALDRARKLNDIPELRDKEAQVRAEMAKRPKE